MRSISSKRKVQLSFNLELFSLNCFPTSLQNCMTPTGVSCPSKMKGTQLKAQKNHLRLLQFKYLALANVSVNYKNIVLTKVISVIWEYFNIAGMTIYLEVQLKVIARHRDCILMHVYNRQFGS